MILIKRYLYFSVPTYLNKAELESLNISAIEEYQNRLYVTNDNRPGNIYIIDRDTNKIVDSIDGFYQNDNLNTYSRVNDISIYAGRLYVSSLSSNRVDVFDIKDNHKHIMSLGTGSWAGGNSLVHAQATVANDEYVFVADSNNTVSVYRQEDIIAQNHFKLKQYHRLELEGSADINRTVQMHIFGDYLLANISGRNYYIYDLRQLESNVGQTPLRAIKKVNLNIQKIDIKDDTILASFSNKIEFYALSDFIKNDFIFTQPTKSISQINKERIGGYDDVLLSENNEIIMAKDETISFIPYKKHSLEYTARSFVEDTKIVFDALPVGTVSQILDNEEAFEIVTNAALRSVRMNSLIKTEILPDKTVRITNYAAKELKDIEIELTLSAVKKWFTLGRIDKIPAFSQIILPLEYFGQNSQFNSVNNDGGQYRKMNALHAKEWLIIMSNFAYMVSQDEFKHLWFNFEDVFGYKMYGNGGPNDVPRGHFLPEDYVHYYDALMARSSISMWRLEMGGGLGNQWNFGISTYGFYSHYYGGWGLIAHEFGHGFDGENLYWDGSGFAAEWAGWQPLIHNLANYHIPKGDLPYMSDDINGFYKDENAKYRSNSVDHNMRRHRSDASMNDIDTYFMGHSKMPQGWFPHRSGFTPETLNNQEKMFLATTRGKNQEGFIDAYACRFDFIPF